MSKCIGTLREIHDQELVEITRLKAVTVRTRSAADNSEGA
jgi:hypothetical protein